MCRPRPDRSTFGRVTPWVMTSGSQFRPGPAACPHSATWTGTSTRSASWAHATAPSAPPSRPRSPGSGSSPARRPATRSSGRWRRQEARHRRQRATVRARGDGTDDAFIAVFDAKYPYNFWRPITAIRNADLSGNPATPREPLAAARRHADASGISVRALHHLGRGCRGAAGRVRQRVREVTMTSPTAPGVTRNGRACRTTPTRWRSPASTAASTTASRTRPPRTWAARSRELTVATQMRGARRPR